MKPISEGASSLRPLKKLVPPPILTENERVWTDEYLEALRAGTKLPARWRHVQIRRVLSEETSHRCAYCDSNLQPVTVGHIEHIIPRKEHPELVVAWTNLTLACNTCNLKKGSYYDPSLQLVNPYVDIVGEHLVYIGETVWPAPGSDRGRETIKQLELFRLELQEARKARIGSVAMMVDVWARTDGRAQETMAELILDDLSEGEHRASVEAYLRLVRFPLP